MAKDNVNRAKALAVQKDVYDDFLMEQLKIQAELKNPNLTASEVVRRLIEKSKELDSLKTGNK